MYCNWFNIIIKNINGIAQAFEFLAGDVLVKKKIDLNSGKGNDEGINLDGGVTPKKKECCK